VTKNALYYGDNLDVLRRHVLAESVDLVYLDPPFNSNATYNILFGHTDEKAAAQIKAFDDTWHWDQAASAAFHEVVIAGGPVANALAAFQTMLGPSTMLAYLSMMAPRLIELRRVLKRTGSLYLHCDPTASHYLKLLLDAIFGANGFRNELIWHYGGRGAKAISRQYPKNHDVLLWYSKSEQWVDEKQYIETQLTAAQAKAAGYRQDDDGRWFRTAPRGDYTDASVERLRAEGRIHDTKTGGIRVKYHLDTREGHVIERKLVGDVWNDIPDAMHMPKAERLGYPTQKPVMLLRRILATSCPPQGVVLDPFCGCGTTIAAAEELGRRWVGIDITSLAISLIKSRLAAKGIGDYRVLGEPTAAEDAAQLAADDPYQFQWWALGLIGARPAEGKKGADRGIDGAVYFFDDASDGPKRLIVSVKAGAVHASHVRDLIGVMQREGADMGTLISLNESTGPMRQEAASAGFYTSPWGQHPRVQLLTVAELLAGKRIDMPAGGAHMTQVALPPTPEPSVNPDQMTLGG
jgi:site-specific DNA-methyltransferase (adenine-specific)